MTRDTLTYFFLSSSALFFFSLFILCFSMHHYYVLLFVWKARVRFVAVQIHYVCSLPVWCEVVSISKKWFPRLCPAFDAKWVNRSRMKVKYKRMKKEIFFFPFTILLFHWKSSKFILIISSRNFTYSLFSRKTHRAASKRALSKRQRQRQTPLAVKKDFLLLLLFLFVKEKIHSSDSEHLQSSALHL